MAKPAVIDLFVEDYGQEALITALVKRLAAELSQPVEVRIRTARGGRPRVFQELELYQRSVVEGITNLTLPDLMIIAIDANCSRYPRARKTIEEALIATLQPIALIACPDPHVERWFMADTAAFARVVGVTPKLGRQKCEKDRYKALLAQTVAEAGHPPTLGGIEFAADLVEAMDLYRAGKDESSLGAFLDDLRAALRSR